MLDAGCGTGYGSKILADGGAASVRGLDLDPRNIRYAKQHYLAPGLSFTVGDCHDLQLPSESLDLVVSSNVLEHLQDPERFLDRIEVSLTRKGQVLLVMPPITNEWCLAENESISFHVSNLTVEEWIDLFVNHGWRVDLFRHTYSAGIEELDFSSPFPSKARTDAFEFPCASRDDLYKQPTLSAIYLLTTQ